MDEHHTLYTLLWPNLWPEDNIGQHGQYFMIRWICLTSWRLFDGSVLCFKILNQYGMTFDFKINVGHTDLYFMVQWFCFIFWRLFEGLTLFWDNQTVWPELLMQNKCSMTYISFDGWTWYFWIVSQCDTKIDLIINVDHSGLYFMVYLFYFISWSLLHGWTSNLQIMSQWDVVIDLIINIGHSALYFMVQYFCFISSKVFHGWTSYFEILSLCDAMIIIADQCSIFHVPVILPYYAPLVSSDLSSCIFGTQKHFSFIDKGQFRRAMLSCDNSYFPSNWFSNSAKGPISHPLNISVNILNTQHLLEPAKSWFMVLTFCCLCLISPQNSTLLGFSAWLSVATNSDPYVLVTSASKSHFQKPYI